MLDEATDGTDNTKPGCNPLGAIGELSSSFYVTAGPTNVGLSGIRYFWTSGLGTIYVDTLPILDTDGNVPPASGGVLQ